MNKVQTITTCGRCGAQEVEEGAHGDFPPVRWARTSLTRRNEGSGWTNHTNLFDDALCLACQEVVLEALKPPVKDAEILNERLGETAGRKFYQASGTTINA